MSDYAEAAAYLGRIEFYSNQARTDADEVRRNVRIMPAMPGFETRAQDALQSAKSQLLEALSQVDKALTDYASKPIQ